MFSAEYGIITRNREAKQGILNNCCIPTTKMAVYPDGTISICEKLNKKMQIGHVDSGLNWDRIGEYITKFSIFLAKCRDCPISRLCHLCYQWVNYDGFRFAFKEPNYCEREIEYRRKLLIRTYEKLEDGVDLLNLY